MLVSIMAESSHCFWTCDRNLVRRLVVTLAYTHCREMVVSGYVVIDWSLSYMLLLIVPEQVRVCHFFHTGTVIVICSCSLLLCFFSPVVQSIWKSFFDF
jgi:hypothetical protein